MRGHAALEILSAAPITLAGSRAASSYGAQVAADLAGELAAAGRTVIAGGGFGGGAGRGGSSEISTWVTEHFTASTVGGVTVYDLTQPAS